jgi:hypothetical protein
MESNVWELFQRAVKGKQGLLRAKLNLRNELPKSTEVENFTKLLSNTNPSYFLIRSSISHLEDVPPNSVDYILTDPPYGHSIQYGELLYLWGAWLKLVNEYEKVLSQEIVINSRQKKNLEAYENLLTEAFKKIYSILKPGKYCTVTFHNPSLKIRNILYRVLINSGFHFKKVSYQKPVRASAKSLLQPIGSQQGDFFFLFQKPQNETVLKFHPLTVEELESRIVAIVVNILERNGEPTPYNEIQNSLDPFLYEELFKAKLLMEFDPRNVKTILKKHVGQEFCLIEGISTEKKYQQHWWLKNRI